MEGGLGWESTLGSCRDRTASCVAARTLHTHTPPHTHPRSPSPRLLHPPPGAWRDPSPPPCPPWRGERCAGTVFSHGGSKAGGGQEEDQEGRGRGREGGRVWRIMLEGGLRERC